MIKRFFRKGGHAGSPLRCDGVIFYNFMNTKKSPKASLGRNRLLGFVVVFSLMCMCLGWSQSNLKAETVANAYTADIPPPSLDSSFVVGCDDTTDITHPVVLPPSAEEEDSVHVVTEQNPEFPGGMGALLKYFGENLRYHSDAVEKSKPTHAPKGRSPEDEPTPGRVESAEPDEPDVGSGDQARIRPGAGCRAGP